MTMERDSEKKMRASERLVGARGVMKLIWISAMVLAAGALQGRLIVEEGFAVAGPGLQGQGSGSGWADAWQTGVGGSDFVVVPGLSQAAVGRLEARGGAVTDSANAASTLYRQLAVPLREDVVYLSFLWRFENRFSAYVGLGTEAHANVYATAAFRVARLDSTQELGWWDPAVPMWQGSGIALAEGETYLVVVKAEKLGAGWGGGDDRLSFWLNPTIGGAEPVADFVATNANFGTLDTERLLVGTNWNGPVVDEVRLGTDWASVTPQVAAQATVSVTATNGSVTIEPQQAGYAYGDVVTFTAQAAPGYLFAGWGGDVSGMTESIEVAVTADLHVEARFIEAARGLRITVETEHGSVQVSPAKETYAQGEVVTLTAVADAGYRFDGWNREVLDYRMEATVVMSGDLLVAPRFVPALYGEGGVGADVREEFVREILYVDAATGSDTNPGTQAQPFKTIGRAFGRAEPLLAGGTGVKVLIQPGEYHEEVRPPAAQFTAPLVIEGAGWTAGGGNTGDVIITGSAPLTGLARNADGIYELPWEHNWGAQTDPFDWAETPTPEGVRRFEWVWHDQQAFNHVFSYAELQARADGYHIFVDEAGDKLYLKGPDGMDLANIGLRMTRFASGAPNNNNFLMWIKGSADNLRSHIVVRNLVFRHAAPGAFRAALHIHEAANVLVEDVEAYANHSLGITAVTAHYSTFRNIRAYRNTIQGGGGGIATQQRWENNEYFDNCEVSFRAGYTGWAPCAAKFGELSHSTLIDLHYHNNWNHGLWLDTGIRQVEVTRFRAINNARNGIYHENNNRNNMPGLGDTKTAVFRHSVVVGNGHNSTLHAATNGATGGGSGFYMTESENTLLLETVLYNNRENVGISYNNRGPISNFAMRDSVSGEPAGMSTKPYGQFSNMVAWQQFFDTFTDEHDYNVYYDADPRPFIGRALAPLDLNDWVLALSSNAFNPNRPVTPDLHSLHIQDYARTEFAILSLHALDDRIAEGENEAAFRFTRVQADVSAPLTVSFTAEAAPGRAGAEDFFGGLPESITIPAGAMHADLRLTPIGDGVAEGPEFLVLTLEPTAAYDQFHYTAVIEISDLEVADLPRVDIYAASESVTEGRDSEIILELVRSGDLSGSLQVQITTGGSSSAGEDWVLASNTVTFAATVERVELRVQLVDDSVAELPKTLSISVVRPGDLSYAPGRDSVAVVTIHDDDLVSPKSVSRSEPSGGRSDSIDLVFANPTDATFGYSLQSVANAWAVDQDAAFAWHEPAGTPVSFTFTTANDDGVSGAIPLGFSFPFFGQNFDAVHVHSNGFLTFVDLANPGDGYRVPVRLPSATGVNPYTIAGYWRNWAVDTTSRITRETDADGNFVVTFRDVYQMPAFPVKRRAIWQVLLRPSGQIELRYLSDATTGNYVIGLQGSAASDGFTIAESGSRAGKRVVLTPLSAFVTQLPESLSIAAASQQPVAIPINSQQVIDGHYAFTIAYQPQDLTLPVLTIPVEFRVGVAVSANYWPTSASDADFWVLIDNYGWIYDADFPYVYHQQQGWLYLMGDSAIGGFYSYDFSRRAWVFTRIENPPIYPWGAVWSNGTWTWQQLID